MAKSGKNGQVAKKEPGTSLTVITPPSLIDVSSGKLMIPGDEISDAFGGTLAETGQSRTEAPGMTIITIDHDTGDFLINGEPTEAIEGYPIYWFQARAYWGKPYKPGSNTPPDCWSPDGLKPAPGEDRQAAACFDCPMAQFGSARQGEGQACRTSTFLFILNPEQFVMPPAACLIAPPSSIRTLVGTGRKPGYLSRAKQFKNPKTGRVAKYYELVFSRFTLEKVENYAVVQGEPLAVAPSADEARAIAKLRGLLMTEFESLRGRIGEGSVHLDADSESIPE